MSRGLGSLQSYVIGVLAVDRHGAEVRVPDLVAGWAHWRRTIAGQCAGESCDCRGKCRLAGPSEEASVHRAVLSLERKGLVTARFDAYGRKVLRLAGVPSAWRPGRGVDDAGEGPRVCAVCGVRAAGRALDRRRRAA